MNNYNDKLYKMDKYFLVLSGILLTNLNIYPLNTFIHGSGAIGRSLLGYLSSDRAILTNFGHQITLFLIGYSAKSVVK